MPYTLEQFCSDARAMLKQDASREGVDGLRQPMSRLITDPDFVRTYFHGEVPYGVRTLHVDPELGFHVLAYRAEKDRTSPAHDHGDSWALYGQVRDYTEMTEYERLDDGSEPRRAKLKVASRYKLHPGEVGLYWGTRLHSTHTPADCCYLRVAGTDLERRPRVRIDQKTGEVLA